MVYSYGEDMYIADNEPSDDEITDCRHSSSDDARTVKFLDMHVFNSSIN